MNADCQLDQPFCKDIPALIMREFMAQDHPHFLGSAILRGQNDHRMKDARQHRRDRQLVNPDWQRAADAHLLTNLVQTLPGIRTGCRKTAGFNKPQKSLITRDSPHHQHHGNAQPQYPGSLDQIVQPGGPIKLPG